MDSNVNSVKHSECYFRNKELLQNTLLPYFCEAEPLKFINKQFYNLNYEKYLKYIQPHGLLETYNLHTKLISDRETYRNGKRDGLLEKWHINGQLDVRCWYKNGKLEGLYEKFSQEGKLSEKCWYKDNKKEWFTRSL
jgi:antitoxin component YwqK of YwqJK toxin-antitoxin module